MSGHEVQHLVHQYGAALVFVAVGLQALCVPVPGTTALIAAAVYAATDHTLPISEVIAAGALGALVGTTAGFAVGRWGGEEMLLRIAGRLRQGPVRVQRLREEFAARGVPWLFLGRFISGLRNLCGLVAGASGMPFGRFLPFSAAAATLWALVNGLEYYWFGHAVAGASTWVQIGLIGAGVGFTVLSMGLLRRRALRSVSPEEA